MKFTYYGHSCFSILSGGKTLLFDPFITGNPLAKDIDVNSIKADYILVSHAHGDHTGDLLQVARNNDALVIGAFEVTTWVEQQGHHKVHPMNFGPRDFEFGNVRFVPAAHSSSFPDGRYGGNAGGFVVKTGEGAFYYTGDTALCADLQLIPRFGKLDFAIMPVGGNFTMDAGDAVVAAELIQCRKVIGVHFDSFGYIVIDHEGAMKKFSDAGMELILPTIGGSMEL